MTPKMEQISPIQKQILDDLSRIPNWIVNLQKLFLGGIVVSAVFAVIESFAIAFVVIFGAGLLVVSLDKWNISRKRKALLSKLRELEAWGELDELWKDYSETEVFLGMKMGRKFIISTVTGVIVRYDEIRNLHQYIHRTNFIEDGRSLRVVTVNGKILNLTNLELRGKADEDLKKALVFMIMKNPAITVGYRN